MKNFSFLKPGKRYFYATRNDNSDIVYVFESYDSCSSWFLKKDGNVGKTLLSEGEANVVLNSLVNGIPFVRGRENYLSKFSVSIYTLAQYLFLCRLIGISVFYSDEAKSWVM